MTSTLSPVAEVTFPPIEIFENRYPQRDYTITISVPEYTSMCPKTGLPDFGTITIEYIPDALCIELKAFKYYMLAYRNVGMFYENVVNKILEDIVEACPPRFLKVTGDFTPRGGIRSVIEVTYPQPLKKS